MEQQPLKHRSALWLKSTNFGDSLTPHILKHYGLEVSHSRQNPSLIGIGSILESVPSMDFGGAVWSTGIMYRKSKLKFTNQKLKIYCVRGRLTRDRINVPDMKQLEEVVLGDGGLLLDRMHPHVPKRYKLGLIPHYVDRETVVKNVPLAKRPDTLLIDVQSGVQKVIDQVRECEAILSSSLHGLIVADAFGIPNRQFVVSTSSKITGNGFKFDDYFSCFGMARPLPYKLSPSTTLEQARSMATQAYTRNNIEALKHNIDRATARMCEAL